MSGSGQELILFLETVAEYAAPVVELLTGHRGIRARSARRAAASDHAAIARPHEVPADRAHDVSESAGLEETEVHVVEQDEPLD